MTDIPSAGVRAPPSYVPLPGSSTLASGNGGTSSSPLAPSGLNLIPSAPADAFGDTAPVPPASPIASVMPASTATSAGEQLATSSPTWGQPIPELFGTCQVLGYPLWTGNVVYGVDDAGNSALQCDFAVIFGRAGPSASGAHIRAVYLDGVPFITANLETGQLSTASDFNYAFYDGTQGVTQIDPTIDSVQAPFTPAFLGMIYLVVTGYQAAGSKFPQVVAELHFNEGSVASGAHVAPFVMANPMPYGSYTDFPLWDFGNGVFYVNYQKTDHSGYILDSYDTNAQIFMQGVELEDSAGLSAGVLNMVLSLDGYHIYMLAGFNELRLYDPATGAKITSIAVPGFNSTEIFCLDDGAHLETILVGTYLRNLNVYTRVGQHLTHIATIDVGALIVAGGDLGSTCYAFCRVYDYSVLNVDQTFTIAYFCAKGAICRYIKTFDGGAQVICTGYFLSAGGSPYSAQYTKSQGVDVMLQLPGDAPYQLYVGDQGKVVYALYSPDGGGTNFVNCYKTIYALFNGGTDPGAGATMSKDDFDALGGSEYFELVYSKPFSSFTNGYHPATQFRAQGQTKIVVGNANGMSVINLNSGQAIGHGRGHYVSLESYGSFDYGLQDFPQAVFWDPNNSCFFYYGMSGAQKDFIGRGYLDNPADTVRKTYALSDALKDISVLAGYDLGDVAIVGLSDDTDVVTGMALNQSVAYSDLISQLAAAFRIDIIETPNFGIKFVKRASNSDPDFTITPADCLQANPDSPDDGHMVTINMLATNQLPTELQLSYVDPDEDYLVATQSARRSIYPHKSATGELIVNISVPIIMTADQAQYYVGFALYDMWSGKIQLTINLPPRYAVVEVGDIGKVTLVTGRIITAKVIGYQANADKSVTLTMSAITINRFAPQKQITDHKETL